MTAYLDCCATTRVDPRVAEMMLRHLTSDFGNAGSRTHGIGQRAKQAVEAARAAVGEVVSSRPDDVVFTSGATESNNLAILGLAHHGEEAGRRHIISTDVEHKAVLEPLEHLSSRGFDVELLPAGRSGWPDPAALEASLRDDTVLVTTMHVNNETGVELPIGGYSSVLADHPAYFHVDAAQSFGKLLEPLRDPRIDMISASAHKVFGPKGVGALVVRRRRFRRPPLRALLYGGGQERGLSPGTQPVHQIVGFGHAAALAVEEHDTRRQACLKFRAEVLQALEPLEAVLNGDQDRTVPHVMNVSFPGVDAEALMLALRDHVAVSNGSACTSESYDPSHVLTAMGLPDEDLRSAIRLSWSHEPLEVPWDRVVAAVSSLRR